MSTTTFRPRSTWEILDAAIQLFREHFAALVVISAVATLPSILVGVYNAIVYIPKLALGSRAVGGPELLHVYSQMAPLMIVGYAWLLVIDGAIVLVVSEAYQGATMPAAIALRRALSRALPILGALIVKYAVALLFLVLGLVAISLVGGVLIFLVGLATPGATRGFASGGLMLVLAFVGTLAAIACAAFPIARYFGVIPAIMLENLGIFGALDRSRALAAGSYRKILATLVTMYLLYLAVYFAVFFAVLMLVRIVNGGQWAAQLITSMVGALISPVLMVTITLLYYDMRMRREGLDLELMADRLGADVAATPAN